MSYSIRRETPQYQSLYYNMIHLHVLRLYMTITLLHMLVAQITLDCNIIK
jgi:hypothetical protein